MRPAICEGPGSSPRGRGKPCWGGVSAREAGLIPARAGKTCHGGFTFCVCGAHPRAGGENHTRVRLGSAFYGSSPRGRGKPRGNLSPPDASRLIPARAGKTCLSACQHEKTWAHPRAGGENTRLVEPSDATLGSSPRGRGKPVPAGSKQPPTGLIPARAGKTTPVALFHNPAQAHPRAGGENLVVGAMT